MRSQTIPTPHWLCMAVSRIPSEILQKIFIQSLPQSQFLAPEVSEVPLKLTLICRAWRDSSITCPWLWASISINTIDYVDPIPGDYEQARREYAHLEAGVEQWLSRSGSLPLTIRYEAFQANLNMGQPLASHTTSRLSDVFAGVASRWEHIEIGRIGSQETLLDCLSSGTQMPFLRELHFLPGLTIESPLDMSHLTHLDVLSINGVRLHRMSETILPPHLKHIVADHLDLNGALRLLYHSPSLRSAQLWILFSTQTTATEQIVLHSLEELSIGFPSVPTVARFWDSVTLPSLKTLGIDWYLPIMNGPPLPVHIPEMLSRSRCDLKCLIIRVHFCPEDVTECISLSPNLQDITIERLYSVSDLLMFSSLLDRLGDGNPTVGNFALCPKLQRLSIQDCSPIHAYSNSLINFLISRFRLNRDTGGPSQENCFHQLEWISTPSFDKEVSESFNTWRSLISKNATLKKCIAAGLCIYLTIDRRKYLFGPSCPQGMRLDPK